MMAVVLLGDSIFDNARYVEENEKAVIEQLQETLPSGSTATLLAVDGSVTREVVHQLKSAPSGTSHLVISSGGNDALHDKQAIMSSRTPEALLKTLPVIQSGFRIMYHRLLSAAKATRIPTVVCTIYDDIPGLGAQDRTLLSLFNDVIVILASREGFPIIDLRSLCTDPKDYSELSPIEPSAQGGMKIATRVAHVVQEHDFSSQRTVIY
jgi:hypothetical protein